MFGVKVEVLFLLQFEINRHGLKNRDNFSGLLTSFCRDKWMSIFVWFRPNSPQAYSGF